jgi:uncharacterized protein YkwD
LLLCTIILAVVFVAAAVLERAACARQITRQIGTYTDRVDMASRLGASGSSAYILSARSSNRGLYITSVSPGSVAAKLGLEQGDVLLQLNNRVVSSAAEADRILAATPSGQLKSVFVKQTSQQLNCYNQSIGYTNNAPSEGSISQGGGMVAKRDSTFEKIQTSVPVQTLESYMCEIVNADRAANGVGRVSLSASLSAVARAHAEDMIARRFFDHVNPSGMDPRQRAVAAGINVAVAENIAQKSGPMSPQQKVAGCQKMMMDEPKNDPHNHRGNILNPSWTCVGIGCAYAPGGGVFVAQEFSASPVP